MNLRDVISDRRFQNADPEDQARVLKQLGVSDHLINQYIEMNVGPPHTPNARERATMTQSVEEGVRNATYHARARDEVRRMVGDSSPLVGLPETDDPAEQERRDRASLAMRNILPPGRTPAEAHQQGRDIRTAVAGMGLLAGVPAILTRAALARAGLGLAGGVIGAEGGGMGGGAIGEAVGHPREGRMAGSLIGGLLGGGLGAIKGPGAVWSASEALPMWGRYRAQALLRLLGVTAPPAPSSMSQNELQTMIRSMGRPPEGYVENPSPEVVREQMSPRPEPSSVLSQGELQGVVRGASRAPQGYVDNPSPRTVAQRMPAPAVEQYRQDLLRAGVDPKRIEELIAQQTSQAAGADTGISAVPTPGGTSAGDTVARTLVESGWHPESAQAEGARMQAEVGSAAAPEAASLSAAGPEPSLSREEAWRRLNLLFKSTLPEPGPADTTYDDLIREMGHTPGGPFK